MSHLDKLLTLLDAETIVDEVYGEDLPAMDAKFAENIVRKWQNIKSQALGANHSIGKLSEVR